MLGLTTDNNVIAHSFSSSLLVAGELQYANAGLALHAKNTPSKLKNKLM